MVARLNLSSQPFRNRTLPWTIAVAVSLVSLAALVYFVAEGQRLRSLADADDRQVGVLRGQLAELQAQANAITEEMPPDQLETLKAAHALVDRKSFSWSRLFSDLESALPAGVRVSRINVREVIKRGGQTRAELDMTVVGRTPTDVTGMITEMGRVGAFAVIPLSENQKSGKGESGYEWLLRVSYVQGARPLDEGEGGPEPDVAASSAAGE